VLGYPRASLRDEKTKSDGSSRIMD